MGNINRELEILRKNKTEMQEIKNTATEMNNVLNVLVSRLYMAERRITELEETSIETFKRK